MATKRKTVSSSQLSVLEYDDVKEQLFVKFHNGTWYVYFDVPKKAAEKFMNSPEESYGKHFWTHIRNNYDYQQVSRK